MKRIRSGKLIYALLLILIPIIALSVAGCSQWKPYKPPESTEIPEGPGLLSGEDGEFVIYRKKSDPPAE